MQGNASSVIFIERTFGCDAAHFFPTRHEWRHWPLHARFVLLFVMADEPFTEVMQGWLMHLRRPDGSGLVAAYATNLQTPSRPDVFRPIPLGLSNPSGGGTGELAYEHAAAMALPWDERPWAMLVPPMAVNYACNSRGGLLGRYVYNCSLRALINDTLHRGEFEGLVHTTTASRRFDKASYARLLAAQRFVLSPPGVGYDSYKTWEIIAAGAVPVVVPDAAFDERLFDGSPVVRLPPLPDLSRSSLEAALRSYAARRHRGEGHSTSVRLGLQWWRQRFTRDLFSNSID